MITTHYTDLCKKVEKNEMNIVNKHMEIYKTNETFQYSYLLKSGISEVKGGVKVLQDLGYPTDMIDNTGKYLSKI